MYEGKDIFCCPAWHDPADQRHDGSDQDRFRGLQSVHLPGQHRWLPGPLAGAGGAAARTGRHPGGAGWMGKGWF